MVVMGAYQDYGIAIALQNTKQVRLLQSLHRLFGQFVALTTWGFKEALQSRFAFGIVASICFDPFLDSLPIHRADVYLHACRQGDRAHKNCDYCVAHSHCEGRISLLCKSTKISSISSSVKKLY